MEVIICALNSILSKNRKIKYITIITVVNHSPITHTVSQKKNSKKFGNKLTIKKEINIPILSDKTMFLLIQYINKNAPIKAIHCEISILKNLL